MDFIRVRTLPQLFGFKDKLSELFYEYIQRTNYKGTAEELFKRCAGNIMYLDHMLFVFVKKGIPSGFLLCNLLGNSKKSILFVDEFYCPNGGYAAWQKIKAITRTFGINEIQGNADEKIYRAYRINVKDADVTKQQIVRIKLWEAAEAKQKVDPDL